MPNRTPGTLGQGESANDDFVLPELSPPDEPEHAARSHEGVRLRDHAGRFVIDEHDAATCFRVERDGGPTIRQRLLDETIASQQRVIARAILRGIHEVRGSIPPYLHHLTAASAP